MFKYKIFYILDLIIKNFLKIKFENIQLDSF